MDITSVVLQALQQADAQANTAASNLAVAGTGSSSGTFTGSGVDTVSLSDSMVALMSAENLYAANIATLNTANQIENALLNVIA